MVVRSGMIDAPSRRHDPGRGCLLSMPDRPLSTNERHDRMNSDFGVSSVWMSAKASITPWVWTRATAQREDGENEGPYIRVCC